jgi:uncharacterized protein YndB with AHSA1/START domain
VCTSHAMLYRRLTEVQIRATWHLEGRNRHRNAGRVQEAYRSRGAGADAAACEGRRDSRQARHTKARRGRRISRDDAAAARQGRRDLRQTRRAKSRRGQLTSRAGAYTAEHEDGQHDGESAHRRKAGLEPRCRRALPELIAEGG